MSSLRTLGFACTLVAATAMTAYAAGPRAKTSTTPDAATAVEMFAAVDQGQIEVRVIPKDSTKANLLIENKSDQPLSVKLPAAFAGIPALAQDDGGFGGGGGGGGGGNQSFGGGGGGGGDFGDGGGGGFFNVAPEQIAKVELTIVCLEHGKADPRPAIPYKIIPIEEYTSNKSVHELLKLLGRGAVSQRVAQAAAWHLANNMSWEELASKQLRFLTGVRRPYFSRNELAAAVRVVEASEKAAKKKPGKSDSMDQG